VDSGFIETQNETVSLKPGLQTQKYSKITLPSITICDHQIDCFEVFMSHFESSWGIDALIGLDFFRRFRVTIDYSNGILLTTPMGTSGAMSGGIAVGTIFYLSYPPTFLSYYCIAYYN
jgi:hypothetical protein